MGVQTVFLVGLVVMATHLPVTQARVVIEPALLTWLLDQTSVGGWSVREWRDHYSQYDQASWAEWYSSYRIGGRQWQPEEWLEHCTAKMVHLRNEDCRTVQTSYAHTVVRTM